MPPTVQTNKLPDREQRQNRNAEKRTELVCRIKYCNTLPDIPFDPKFIQYPFDATRFICYKPTTLERNYKYEVLTEHDLGVSIDLIDKDAYAADAGATLDPADEKLLEEDVLTPQDSVRSRHHARSVSWLRRTEYISTEQTRFQPQTMDKVEAKVGYSIKKNLKEDPLIMDRESQIKAIERTFEDSLKPIQRHYSKPNVEPVEVLPVFPDFDGWKYPCAQVIFDSDPAPIGRSVPTQLEEMSQAMIRGVMDESGEQFVAYFLPTEETLNKRKSDALNNLDYEDDQEYEYKMAREYNWNVKNKASKGYEENYFLVVRDGGIYYNELETRVRLSKRRQKPGQAQSNTRLVIKHRAVNEFEYKMQRYRERQLECPGDEDDEEEEEEPVMESETITVTRAIKKFKGSDEENEENEEERGSEKEESDNESGRRSYRYESENDNKTDDEFGSRNKSDDEGGSESEIDAKRFKSLSRSPSRSGSGSRASSVYSLKSKSSRKSRSRSRTSSGSRSRTRSGSISGSDNEGKKSKTPSRSPSGSPMGSRDSSVASRNSKGSRKSRSRSRTRSRSSWGSRSRSGSGSRSGNE